MGLTKEELKAKIKKIKTPEDRRNLVQAIAEIADKEERDEVRRIFSDMEKDAEGGKGGQKVQEESGSVLDDLVG